MLAFDQLPDLLAEHATRGGPTGARIFLVDPGQEVLREVTGQGIDAGEGGEADTVDGTLPGHAFSTTRSLSGSGEVPRRWWVPVLDGTERLGVLRAGLAQGGDTEDLQTPASPVGLRVVSKRPPSDAPTRQVRTQAMGVARPRPQHRTEPSPPARLRATSGDGRSDPGEQHRSVRSAPLGPLPQRSRGQPGVPTAWGHPSRYEPGLPMPRASRTRS